MNDFEIRERGRDLYDYLTYNFIPPIREEVKESWVRQFNRYWRREISYEELVASCPVDEEELLERFDTFFFEEDVFRVW